jgi:hypothetical protein
MKRIGKMVISALICGVIFTLIGCEKNDNLEIEDCGKVTLILRKSAAIPV